MKRAGFTFIELIIVIVLIGTMTVIGIGTFDSTRSRILFFGDVSKIESNLKSAKSSAVSDKQQLQNEVAEQDTQNSSGISGTIAWFDYNDENSKFDSLQIYSTASINNLAFDPEIHLELSNLDFGSNENLKISEINFYDNEENELELSDTVKEDFYIVFLNDGKCNFTIESGEVPEIMMSMPLELINGENSNVLRNLYIHKTACMPEVLISNFFDD